MTEQEARKHISNFNEHKNNRHFLARFKSTTLEITDEYVNLQNLAEQAKIALGKHPLQQPYENLIKFWPKMTREYYDTKRKEKNIT